MQTSSEPIFDFVKRMLQEQKGTWRRISINSDVPYDTLSKIALGRVRDPRINTIQKLADYFTLHIPSANEPITNKEAA
jgi:predicted transcriptional regulator